MRNRITRRAFLFGGLCSAGAVWGLTGCSSFSRHSSQARVWAFLSDVHIPGEGTPPSPSSSLFHFGPAENLEQAVRQIVARPEIGGSVVTGDLARLTGQANDYVLIRKILEPLKKRGPVLLALGNHDSRDNCAKTFPEKHKRLQPVDGRRILVEEGKDCTLVVLDSNKGVNVDAGELGEAQKVWLGDFLKEHTSRKPVLLFVHHTPKDLPDLLEIARPAAQVKAIVFGHSHVYGYAEQDGLHLVNLPAMGYSFARKEPVGWVEAALGEEEGVFTLRVVGGERERDGEMRRLRWR